MWRRLIALSLEEIRMKPGEIMVCNLSKYWVARVNGVGYGVYPTIDDVPERMREGLQGASLLEDGI